MATDQEVKKWTWLMDDVEVKGTVYGRDATIDLKDQPPLVPNGKIWESPGAPQLNIVPDANYRHLVAYFKTPIPGQVYEGWAPGLDQTVIHLETYPAANIGAEENCNRTGNWPLPDKGNGQFQALDESTGQPQPVKVGDHVRVRGRWLIENAHCLDHQVPLPAVRNPYEVLPPPMRRSGFVFPELHAFYWNDIRLVQEKPKSSDIVEETVSVAAPIYEQIDVTVGWDKVDPLSGHFGAYDAFGRYWRNGTPYYKVMVAQRGDRYLNFHDRIEANASIDAPPLPSDFHPDSSLIGYDEAVLKIGSGLTVDRVRSLAVRPSGLSISAVVRGDDVNGPANNKSVFQARYRVWWKSRLEVSPTSIYVGADLGGTTNFVINVVNRGPDPITISDLRLSPSLGSAFQIALPSGMIIGANSSATLNGVFSPGGVKGMFSGTLQIISNDPSERYPIVALQGLAPPVPLISPGDVAADFEGPGEFTFSITNTGLLPLHIGSVSNPSPPFSIVTNLPSIINPLETKPLVVKFAPPRRSRANEYTSSITINSDADNAKSLTLSLHGTGIAREPPESRPRGRRGQGRIGE